MRKVLSLIAVFIGLITVAQAQKKSELAIPNAVKVEFAKKHPNVTNARWEKEKQDFEVSFKLDGKKASELYDSKGNFLESEISITAKDLPTAVALKIKDLKYKDLDKITKANGTVLYEVEVKGKDLLFDAAGNEVKP